MLKPDKGTLLLKTHSHKGPPVWLKFSHPLTILSAFHINEVLPLLHEVDQAVRKGRYAAGFISYEAAPAFDPALTTHPGGALPLLWFGLYKAPEIVDAPSSTKTISGSIPWTPHITPDEYHAAIARIKNYIAAGDTYQVNYTFRLSAKFQDDPFAFFIHLCQAAHAPYAAYLHTGTDILCSVSPELFFEVSGKEIRSRPMKGTAPRGRWTQEDLRVSERLQTEEKSRAENVMVVDMIRNDMGRIARPGSVQVKDLFSVERYPTLWQMTSTITAETDASFAEIFTALFPCASITGAPKIRTMQIIAELEKTARGIYTGSIGYLSPERKAQFNVAIRTVHISPEKNRAEYGTGGGIVWDSTDHAEYEECRTKTLVLNSEIPDVQLQETIIWTPDSGYFLYEKHLDRLLDSSNYFGFHLDGQTVRDKLYAVVPTFCNKPTRLRLLISREGTIEIQTTPAEAPAMTPADAPTWPVALATHPIHSDNALLFHKTTSRDIFDSMRKEHPLVRDVILWNERGELTETTIANLVLVLKGKWVTPPVECGLLGGTFRADLLERSLIAEQVVSKEDLSRASAVYAINSVRGWRRLLLMGQ